MQRWDLRPYLHGYGENTVEMSEADDVLADKESHDERVRRPMFAALMEPAATQRKCASRVARELNTPLLLCPFALRSFDAA